MNIHFICDHKWRDLPNLATTKLFLERLGHRVTMASSKETFALLATIAPDCVVFNHFNGETYRRLGRALRDSGVAIALLPTEGLPHPIALNLVAGEFTDYSLLDIYLSWNDIVAEAIVATGAMRRDQVPVVGCGRMDFYAPRMAGLVEKRDALFDRLNLAPGVKLVTWATQYNFADVGALSGEQFEKFLREATDLGAKPCLDRAGIDFRTLPAEQFAARAAAVEGFKVLVRETPNVQFLIKPHPAESVAFYRKLVDELRGAGASVQLCLGTYIWDILYASSVHLHFQCTTAVEAWNLDLPTVEMKMLYEAPYEWPERERGSDVAHDAAQLCEIVRRRLDGPSADDNVKRVRRDYIDKWLYRIDGKRCETVAATLDAFLKARPIAKRPLRLPDDLAPSFVQRVTARGKLIASIPANTSLRTFAKRLVRKPNEAEAGVFDKQITQKDVREYSRRLTRLL